MEKAPFSKDEHQRLAALRDYKILDTLPEADFDDFTQLASNICGTPIALISLIDKSRQWFKSTVGLDASETPRDVAFCSHAILQDDVFVISDSFEDPRFHDNPLATEAPNVRFYAGAPLITGSGLKLGTLCVIDSQPRTLQDDQIQALEALARQVVNQLDLRLAKIHAEDTLKMKSLFLATMSHEIRTPLNGVLGCANILMETLTDPQEIKLVKTITNCGDSLLLLINDVLDFSKLESGKMEVENRPFSLIDVAEQVIQLFSNEASAKSNKVNLEYKPDTPASIYGDPTRIRQILSNFLSNAIKFTESGDILVIIESTPSNKLDADHKIQISVVDCGVGIDPEDQEKLFHSFSQLDASTSRKFGGTGLGLSICKALADLMGGEITVESEPGKGSCFSFTIDTKEALEAETLASSSIEVDPTMGTHTPLKILLAEDNIVNQVIAKKLLEKFGYITEIASNGIQALEKLQEKTFDVVLMDCFMPKMDGFAATQSIKKEPEKYGSPRIVALTASALDEDRQKCFEAGMDDFLSKPLDTAEILRALRESFQLKTSSSLIGAATNLGAC